MNKRIFLVKGTAELILLIALLAIVMLVFVVGARAAEQPTYFRPLTGASLVLTETSTISAATAHMEIRVRMSRSSQAAGGSTSAVVLRHVS